MTDAYTRRIFAAYATFDEPSYRSLMMVMRECVKRFGRLPQTVVVLTDLLEKKYDPDDIYGLIAQDKIYVDLFSTPLAEPAKVKIFIDPEIAQAYSLSKDVQQQSMSSVSIVLQQGTVIALDGILLEIIFCGETSIFMKDEKGNSVDLDHERFMVYVRQGKITGVPRVNAQDKATEKNQKKAIFEDPEALKEANRRMRILSGDCSDDASERTRRRWQKSFEEAELVDGKQLGINSCGNYYRY